MTKQQFTTAIAALQAQYDHDRSCSDAWAKILPNDFTSGYDTHFATNGMINLLCSLMNDEGKDSMIDYFIHDLDFGRAYYKGCLTQHGKTIDISTSVKLYEYLIKQK